MKAMQSEETINQLLQSSEDFNQRVLSRASSVSPPTRWNGFEGAQKQQLEMMKMGVKMGAAMFKGGNKTAPPPPPTVAPAEAK